MIGNQVSSNFSMGHIWARGCPRCKGAVILSLDDFDESTALKCVNCGWTHYNQRAEKQENMRGGIY